MRFLKIEALSIEGVFLLTRMQLPDERGYFERLFCSEVLSTVLEDLELKQINRSYSTRSGTVRGMHLQNSRRKETAAV